MFREFVYLNSKLVNQFLAQAEGGLFDEAVETTSETGKGGIGAGVKTPVVEARADKSKEHSFQDERRVRQTPESQFNRLYEHLEKDGLLAVDAIDDRDYVSSLPRASLLEIHDVQLARSGFQELGGMAKQVVGLMPLVEAFGVDTDMSPADRSLLDKAASLDDDAKPLGVIGLVPGIAKVKLALELDRESILGDIEGEATVLAKVTKTLKPGRRTWLAT